MHSATWLGLTLGLGAALQAAPPLPLPDPPGLDACAVQRGDLSRCRARFEADKTGVVAYLGGSITHNPGWTQQVDAELQRRFPTTKFTFIHAGIPSIDSTGHAFRLGRDVLAHGTPDLMFVEAAVNDLHNQRTALESLRGMEGIVRQALRANPAMDLVFLHFAEPRHTADYAAGRVPAVIVPHEQVAARYGLTSLDLAHEVQLRLAAGQFDWARDFVDLHPSPFGQGLYYHAIARLFTRCWAAPTRPARPQPLPTPLDAHCYDSGTYLPLARAEALDGFALDPNWHPAAGGTREGWVDVPMLVGERAGAGFSLAFDGRAIGLSFAAGPDTAVVRYRVDGGEWHERDTFTPWSAGLHLPWFLLLEADLPAGAHRLELRLAGPHKPGGSGTALRIRDFLLNGSIR